MAQVLKIQRVSDHIRFVSGVVSLMVDRELYQALPNGPHQICDYVRSQLTKRKSKRKTDDFEIFTDELRAVWDAIERHGLEGTLNIVIGVCGPNLAKIAFKIPHYDREKILITVNMTPDEMKAVHPFWFHYFIQKRIQSKGYSWEPDPSCSQSVWERVTHSKERVVNFPLEAKPIFNPQRQGKKYRVVAHKDSGDISVIIGTLAKTKLEDLFKAIINDIKLIIENICCDDNNTGIYKIFSKHIKAQLQRAFNGPQSYGVGFPLSFLGALRSNIRPLNRFYDPLFPLAYLHGLRAGLQPVDFLSSRLTVDEISLNRCHKQLKHMQLIAHVESKNCDIVPPRIILKGFVQGYINPEHCKAGMESAKNSLLIPKNQRLFNTMMIGISGNDISKYHDVLSALKNKVICTVAQYPGKELYHINLQFFPLTRIIPRKNHTLKVVNNQFKDSRWCNLLIREMAGLQGVQNEPLWFARRMEPTIPLDHIKASLNMLKKGGFLKVDHVSHTLRQTAKDIISDLPSYVQGSQFHIDVIDLALYSQEWEKKGKGEFVSTSLCCSQEGIKELRKILQDFMKRIFDMASDTQNPNLIYQASFQFFPLIKKIVS